MTKIRKLTGVVLAFAIVFGMVGVMKTEVSAAFIERNITPLLIPVNGTSGRITLPFDMNRNTTLRVNFTSSPGGLFSVRLESATWQTQNMPSSMGGVFDFTFDIPNNRPLHERYTLVVTKANIMQATTINGSWRYTCNNAINRNARFRIDSSFIAHYGGSSAVAQVQTVQNFGQATNGMAVPFGIQFPTGEFATNGNLLDGHVPHIHGNLNSTCSITCGLDCEWNHHRSDIRLLNRAPRTRTGSTHIVNLVGHSLCLPGILSPLFCDRNNGMAGRSVVGSPTERDSLVTTQLTHNNLTFPIVIQHELTHNLGAPHCNSNGCVMNFNSNNTPVLNNWCNTCREFIWSFRRYT